MLYNNITLEWRHEFERRQIDDVQHAAVGGWNVTSTLWMFSIRSLFQRLCILGPHGAIQSFYYYFFRRLVSKTLLISIICFFVCYYAAAMLWPCCTFTTLDKCTLFTNYTGRSRLWFHFCSRVYWLREVVNGHFCVCVYSVAF